MAEFITGFRVLVTVDTNKQTYTLDLGDHDSTLSDVPDDVRDFIEGVVG